MHFHLGGVGGLGQGFGVQLTWRWTPSTTVAYRKQDARRTYLAGYKVCGQQKSFFRAKYWGTKACFHSGALEDRNHGSAGPFICRIAYIIRLFNIRTYLHKHTRYLMKYVEMAFILEARFWMMQSMGEHATRRMAICPSKSRPVIYGTR